MIFGYYHNRFFEKKHSFVQFLSIMKFNIVSLDYPPISPVSYKHLDVYKRQAPAHGDAAAAQDALGGIAGDGGRHVHMARRLLARKAAGGHAQALAQGLQLSLIHISRQQSMADTAMAQYRTHKGQTWFEYNNPYVPGEPWCAAFVQECARIAGVNDCMYSSSAHCTVLAVDYEMCIRDRNWE